MTCNNAFYVSSSSCTEESISTEFNHGNQFIEHDTKEVSGIYSSNDKSEGNEKVAEVNHDCVVHSRKHKSQYNNIVNKLRRTDQYHVSVLRRLPGKCCSCNGKTGLTEVNTDAVVAMCGQILSEADTAKLHIIKVHVLFLLYERTLSAWQRLRKSGRFIGKEGTHLRTIENLHHVSIYIVNKSSSKCLQSQLQHLLKQDGTMPINSSDGLYILIRRKLAATLPDTSVPLAEIAEILRTKWDAIQGKGASQQPATIKTGTTNKSNSTSLPLDPCTEFIADDRWNPKRSNHITETSKSEEEEQFQNQSPVLHPRLKKRRPRNYRKSARINCRQTSVTFGLLE